MVSLRAARPPPISILATRALSALLVVFPLTIGPTAADIDDIRAGTYDLGDITSQARAATATGTPDGVDDTVDYLRFSLTDTREVMLNICQLDARVRLYLQGQDGNVLAGRKNPGTGNETIRQELGAGTYYAGTKAARKASNSYQLSYKATNNIPENVAPTGASTISGSPEVGETLSADISGISDDNSLANAVFAYQWLRSDTAISSATNSAYALTADDEGQPIKVRVSFTDDDGFAETRTSAATAPTPTGRSRST